MRVYLVSMFCLYARRTAVHVSFYTYTEIPRYLQSWHCQFRFINLSSNALKSSTNVSKKTPRYGQQRAPQTLDFT